MATRPRQTLFFLPAMREHGKVSPIWDDGRHHPREAQAQALKEVIAWQIERAIQADGMTKTAMANRMATSRAQLDRLPDPIDTSVTPHTLQKAAAVVGRLQRLELVQGARRKGEWAQFLLGTVKPTERPIA